MTDQCFPGFFVAFFIIKNGMRIGDCTLIIPQRHPKALGFVGFPGVFKGKKRRFCLSYFPYFPGYKLKSYAYALLCGVERKNTGGAMLNHNKFRFGEDIMWEGFQCHNRLV